MRRLRTIQDRVADKYGYTRAGNLKAGSLPAILEGTKDMITWRSLFPRLTGSKVIRKIMEVYDFKDEICTRGPVIYVRFNLATHDLYVGETDDWENRVKRHFSAVCRHSMECPRQCIGCDEHLKYMKHQVVEPHRWVMIPILACESKLEALKLEKRLIRRWKPSLNSKEKPYWNLKDTYCRQARRRRTTMRKTSPPWQIPGNERGTSSRPMFSTYWVGGKRFYNLATVLHKYRNKGTAISVRRGNMDVTNWRNTLRSYGTSRTSITINGHTTVFSLDQWRHQEVSSAITHGG